MFLAKRDLRMMLSEEDQEILRTKLLSAGFAKIQAAISETHLAALCEESARQFERAQAVTGGEVLAYSSRLSRLGPVGISFLSGEPMRSLLFSAFGQAYLLNPHSSCYTYYREGDYIAVHRDDASGCEITALVYLVAESPAPGRPDSGLYFDIYQDNDGRPGNLFCSIKTMRGILMLGHGSKVWHGRKSLLAGERVDMVAACFTSH